MRRARCLHPSKPRNVIDQNRLLTGTDILSLKSITCLCGDSVNDLGPVGKLITGTHPGNTWLYVVCSSTDHSGDRCRAFQTGQYISFAIRQPSTVSCWVVKVFHNSCSSWHSSAILDQRSAGMRSRERVFMTSRPTYS